tara:strand:+ start:1289 stop:1540 length:252 start_codon:yes stop_codon:yes gene_type:complete
MVDDENSLDNPTVKLSDHDLLVRLHESIAGDNGLNRKLDAFMVRTESRLDAADRRVNRLSGINGASAALMAAGAAFVGWWRSG